MRPPSCFWRRAFEEVGALVEEPEEGAGGHFCGGSFDVVGVKDLALGGEV